MTAHTPPEPGPLGPPAGLSPLETAVLQTVAYVDMYDYPLSAAEVHRYLVGQAAAAGEVERLLSNGRLAPERLARLDDYFALPGREAILATRRRRAAAAQELWPAAVRYGQAIGQLPFVRMVAVTGSLAVDNAEADADIDYLIVTAPGRLWLCRALVVLLVRLAARRGVNLCPNYFLSERALAFTERNLYTAREVAQMAPITGLAVYQRLRQANDWVLDFLPNAGQLPPRPAPGPVAAPAGRRWPGRAWLRSLAEWALRTPPGGWLEQWEMRRKITRFSRWANDESAFSADWCKGHFASHGRRAMSEFQQRWQQVVGQGQQLT